MLLLTAVASPACMNACRRLTQYRVLLDRYFKSYWRSPPRQELPDSTRSRPHLTSLLRDCGVSSEYTCTLVDHCCLVYAGAQSCTAVLHACLHEKVAAAIGTGSRQGVNGQQRPWKGTAHTPERGNMLGIFRGILLCLLQRDAQQRASMLQCYGMRPRAGRRHHRRLHLRHNAPTGLWSLGSRSCLGCVVRGYVALGR